MNAPYFCKQRIHILECPWNKCNKAFCILQVSLPALLLFLPGAQIVPRTVSTWPNIIVADVVIFSLCASIIISSHSCVPHFPLLIRRLTLSVSISAPGPGSESRPASFNAIRTSRCVDFASLVICATSGGPKRMQF